MAEERTWITPLNASAATIRDCKDELKAIIHALRVVGNDNLANRLDDLSTDLSLALRLHDEGRDRALGLLVSGAEAASRNMVNAAIAVGQKE